MNGRSCHVARIEKCRVSRSEKVFLSGLGLPSWVFRLVSRSKTVTFVSRHIFALPAGAEIVFRRFLVHFGWDRCLPKAVLH